MTIRVRPHHPLPPFKWWTTGLVEDKDGQEYRFIVLKLPSYHVGYSLRNDDYRWQQLSVQYHGKHGLRLAWRDCS